MSEFDLSAIKLENTRNILNTLRQSERMSRSDISSLTGLSLMTVGKTVDLLCSVGILDQEKRSTGAAGRQSLFSSINTSRKMMRFDLSEKMKLCSVDILNNTEANYSLTWENIEAICAECFFESAKNGELIGIGLILPDDTTDSVLERFNALALPQPDVISTYTNAAAFGAYKDERLAVFLSSSDGKYADHGSVILNRKLISTPQNSCLGTLEDSVELIQKLFSPDIIRICASSSTSALQSKPYENIEFIEISDQPCLGMASMLTDKYLAKLCR